MAEKSPSKGTRCSTCNKLQDIANAEASKGIDPCGQASCMYSAAAKRIAAQKQ
jgi:hypothetical protein